MTRWWYSRPMVYGLVLAGALVTLNAVEQSIATDAQLELRDRLEQRAVVAAKQQAERTRRIQAAYADSLTTARAAVRAALAAVKAEVPTLSLPMQRLVASCSDLEVRSGQYVVTVLQHDVATDAVVAAEDVHVATLTREAHPPLWRRVIGGIRHAAVPLAVGIGVGFLARRPP